MKKVSFYLLLSLTLCFSISGCGGSEAEVIEAPVEVDDAAAMDGMDDDEYNKAMNSKQDQGN